MYSALFTKKTEIIYDNSSTEPRLEKEETMNKITLTLEETEDGWTVTGRVSAAALFTTSANMYPGDIRKCDTALI